MKLYKLEAVRGLAALYVILHHSIPHEVSLGGVNLGILLKFGQEAVILFFLLSGFVIDYSFSRGKDKSFSTYFQKRFFRLYIPLLFVFLLGYLSVSASQAGFVNPDWKNLVQNLFMLQDMASLKPAVLAKPYMGNSPLWSLSYEWWFYMLFYPLVRFIKAPQQQSKIVFGLGVVSTLLYALHPNAILRVLMYLSVWWLGVFLSRLYREERAITPRAIALPMASLALSSTILLGDCWVYRMQGNALQFGIHPILELRHFAFAIIIPLAAMLWRKLNWIGFDPLVKPFAALAPISYVAYISHYDLVVKAKYLSFLNNTALEWLGYMGLMLGFSYVLELKIYPALRSPLVQMTQRITQRFSANPMKS